MTEPVSIAEVDRIVAQRGRGRESLLPILQAVQKQFKHLPEPALRRICEITDITPAALEGVATFFPQFRRTPVGRHMISVCDGTACHVKGAQVVYDAVRRELDLKGEADTDTDRLFTIQKVACLGCCTLAPAVQIDSVTYGHVRTDAVGEMLKDFLHQEAHRTEAVPSASMDTGARGQVRIGLGSCCVAGGSAQIRDALHQAVARLDVPVEIKPVGCVGMCHRTPLVEVVLPGQTPRLYAKVRAEDIPEIVARHFTPDHPFLKVRTAASRWLEHLYTNEGHEAPERHAIDVRDPPVAGFLDRQVHLATEFGGELDPSDLEEYQRLKGFQALEHVLDAEDPDALLDVLARSGLRGRGGGGFPTARKWAVVKEAPGDQRTIICNGDEGDPGAFMDRMILESYPFRVIEGMIIASRVVGAHEGIFYIRAEYPLAVRRVRQAIRSCERAGLLGDRVMGRDHAFHLRVREGAGAFVCGEESALIASLEGRRGMPSFRPPFPAERGLHGRPTLVNNVETFALVPWILREGAEAFAALGTPDSKGTKVFSLAGKIQHGGLIEVPMGMTIREVVEEIGGGVGAGRTFKAVQIGGPSGGCIPASMADMPIDYEDLAEAGAMMGSGGLVVLDDRDCLVEMSRYFLSFTQGESCGRCTPCRVGTRRMLDLLTNLCQGRGRPGDLEQLEQLSRTVQSTSLCGLGKTAPNPVLTMLQYFREEFEAHLAGRCPAGSCQALIRYAIDPACIGCAKCARECPVDAIRGQPYELHTIDPDLCIRCDNCRQVCPVQAVEVH